MSSLHVFFLEVHHEEEAWTDQAHLLEANGLVVVVKEPHKGRRGGRHGIKSQVITEETIANDLPAPVALQDHLSVVSNEEFDAWHLGTGCRIVAEA